MEVISELIKPFGAEYEEYLRDESRCSGEAGFVSFPTTEDQVREVLREAARLQTTITVQGARTGIVAGAVPQGGLILNLSRMKGLSEIAPAEDRAQITARPGTLLTELREKIEKQGWFFPPDPTETSASIGGMIAANASGALTFHYGPTRCWVDRLRVVLADGDVINLPRGTSFAQGRSFELTTESGRTLRGFLPSYNQPDIKSAAGYFVRDNMDLIDLFIGMEGTLGIVTEADLRLIPLPQACHGLVIFLPCESAALKLVRTARGEHVPEVPTVESKPVAIEFFSKEALDLLRSAKEKYSAFEAIPALNPAWHTAVYVEYHACADEEAEESICQVMEAAAALGSSEDDTWYGTNRRELEPIKAFRHAVPEAVNLLVDERKRQWHEITKLGTDMSVPDEYLEAVVSMYRRDLSEHGLEFVMFGHIGNNHVHVNIIPRSPEEYALGRSLYMKWAEEVVRMGGSVSAEHGIGKLKVQLLELMYGSQAVEEMRALKRLFDPGMILNPGNLFAVQR
ncbi:MAG: FAD-binding oxidoreductase [Armatimonadota bacterium]|nr:FAD-binding oxidoreductase [Armatimonadota bacterium]